MTTLRISLRAGEKIFVNGAVLRVDRKTSIEFLNDVTFLLESHVMQPEDARTPLRQLYFIIQMILIDPADAEAARRMFARSVGTIMGSFQNAQIRDGLADVEEMVSSERTFEALKRLRGLLPLEDLIMAGKAVPASPAVRRLDVPQALGAL